MSQPEGTPGVEKFEPTEDPDEESPWSWIFAAAGAIGFAILCFTPVWDQVHHGGRRGAWLRNALESLGQGGVAAIAGAFAILFIIQAVRAFRRDRS